MNGDHAATVKKDFRLMREWKEDVKFYDLGEDVMLSQSAKEMVELLWEANDKKIAEAGGQAAWDVLPKAEQLQADVDMMNVVIWQLGRKAYYNMTDEERQVMDLFIWVGCCMHKELNSVKHANLFMVKYWRDNKITGPILMPNKDNRSALADLEDPSEASTPAELRALNTSTSGGVKATSIAGALFNHKDDKKGHQDLHRIYFQPIKNGDWIKFPDTSNIRYQSHCDAAAELITYRIHYIEFLESIRDRKKDHKFNNMELNLYHGLKNWPTCTELAALALYGEQICAPYISHIRASPDLNHLTLGPFHGKLTTHIKKLIAHTDVLSSDPAEELTFLRGKDYKYSGTVIAIQEAEKDMPHFRGVYKALLTGALESWENFTEEFTTGGDIDLAADSELEDAWMPATNDVNEGALGALRKMLRENPNMSLHLVEAFQKFKRNDTQSFMDFCFQAVDHRWLMREARHIDSLGLSKIRAANQLAHDRQVEELTREKLKEKARKEAALKARLDAVELIQDAEAINKLTNKLLDEQLAVHRRMDPAVPKVGQVKVKSLKITALVEAVARYRIRLESRESNGAMDLESHEEDSDTGLQYDDEDEDEEELY